MRVLDVTALLSVALIVRVLYSLRREHIRVEYSVSWLAASLLIFILSLWPGALRWLAGIFGVSTAPSALAAVAMGVFLLVLFRVSMIVSELKDNNIALAQKVAILEYELRGQRKPGPRDFSAGGQAGH
ncbi:MAG: DUF2304 domain-containing protein [Bryobacteraceae bacterium]